MSDKRSRQLRLPRDFCSVCGRVIAAVALASMCSPTPAAARGHGLRVRHAHRGSVYAPSYVELPYRVPLEPGTAEILRPHCDDAYPMTESAPCGTATGGPVGGLGS